MKILGKELTYTGKKVYHAGNKPTVSEIGAAAASHGRHMPDTCETITDWNNATKNGWYMSNNAANGPTTVASGGTIWYFGEVITHNTNYVIQVVYQFTASTDAKSIPKYIRAKMNGTWGAWTNVTVSKAVPSNAVFTDTNTWRGVQDNLTSTATDQSLSANQGKVLKSLIDGKAASSHNHGLLHDSFGVTIADTTTDNGWSMINGSYNGFLLKSIRSSASAPAWLQGNYSAGIAFGGADTKGVMSVAYNAPSVKFAGGNGTKPVWYFTVNGSSGKTYNMDSLAANTANTLATARTINGTSFDGSANITTANWGTARNIQIGNTAKSVNGSGNVSWTLAEIGASRAHSASHAFGGNQNAITTAQFITMLTNLGAFSQPHWVSRGSWSYASNQYINDTKCGNIHLAGCVVEVFGNTSAYTIKVTTPTTSSSGVTNGDFIYVNNGSDYSPGWRRLYSTAYKPTASEIGAAASSHTHNYAGSSSAGGAANTAVKLATARTIALGGILSGSASFDGSGNVTINATANDITTITKSLKVTTSWMDTGITGTNLTTGTYAVQMYVNDGTNTSQYQETYSGIMSWYNGGTNSTDADEILLHKAGHASNGRHVYLRTIRTPNSGYLKLQISCTHAFSAASSITFKFKKLI